MPSENVILLKNNATAYRFFKLQHQFNYIV